MSDIIDDLVGDLKPSKPERPGLTLLAYLSVAVLISTIVVLTLFGPRPDLAAAVLTTAFWVKAVMMAVLAACAWPVLLRLSRPGYAQGFGLVLAGVLGTALVLAGGVNVIMAPAETRMDLFLGHSWQSCLWKVALLSAPIYVGSIFGMRRLAPTRLNEAGLAAGLVAGGVGATIYSISCTEVSLTFLSSWYLLAVLLVAVTGALIGPRLLRW